LQLALKTGTQPLRHIPLGGGSAHAGLPEKLHWQQSLAPGVCVEVGVRVGVGVDVRVGVFVGVRVEVEVGVVVGVLVAVGVSVGVGV